MTINNSQPNAASITLREATPDDEPFLLEVYASTRAIEMELVPWTDEQKKAFVEMQFRAQDSYYREQFPNAEYKLMLLDEERVGRIIMFRDKSEIRILDITVLPQYRNAGIGTSLIRKEMNEGAKSGLAVEIYVENTNPSLRLFEPWASQSLKRMALIFCSSFFQSKLFAKRKALPFAKNLTSGETTNIMPFQIIKENAK